MVYCPRACRWRWAENPNQPNQPNAMKTSHVTSLLRNAANPAAHLAAWQSLPAPFRMIQLRERMARKYCPPASLTEARREAIAAQNPEMSGPEAEHPLLWVREDSPEVMECFAGRDFLDHRGWYSDEFQDETLETYAVRLSRLPRLMFYAVKESTSGDLRVSLEDWEEIDFSECESEHHVSDCVREAAKGIVRGYESATEREAEDSREYYRKDRAKMNMEENRETLAGLRREIRALAHELKRLCPSPLATQYPAAAKSLRVSLQGLLSDRRRIMRENTKLAASL